MANQVTTLVPSIEQIAAEIRAELNVKHPPVYPVEKDEDDVRLALFGERYMPNGYFSYGEDWA